MKKDKIIYWVATSIVTLMSLMAGFMYFTNPMVAEGFKHLGYPDYFRVELGIAKILGSLALILPMIPVRFKEWAYAGLGITFISAFISHTAVDGASTAVGPIVSLAFLVISYLYFIKLNRVKTVHA